MESKISYRQELKQMPVKFADFFVDKEYTVTKYLVYDPDTINAVIKIENKEVTFPFRLLGFDSIEKRHKLSLIEHLSPEDLMYLKAKYTESEQLINNLLKGKQLKVICGKLDLYGRILADIYVQGENEQEIHINREMIKSGLVFEYSGKKKLTIDQQIQVLKDNDQKLLQQVPILR